MKTLLVPILLACATACAAQDPDSYIEVTITDTADAPVKRIAYMCTVQIDYSAYANEDAWATNISSKEQKRRQEKWQQVQDSLCSDQAQLRSELADMGFVLSTYNAVSEYNVLVQNSAACGAGDIVDLRSKAELKRLVAFIRSKKNVNGNVLIWQSDLTAWDRAALSRMHRQANDQAADLAAVSGKRLGGLIWAKETTEFKTPTTVNGLIQYGVNVPTGPDPRRMTFRFELLAK